MQPAPTSFSAKGIIVGEAVSRVEGATEGTKKCLENGSLPEVKLKKGGNKILEGTDDPKRELLRSFYHHTQRTSEVYKVLDNFRVLSRTKSSLHIHCSRTFKTSTCFIVSSMIASSLLGITRTFQLFKQYQTSNHYHNDNLRHFTTDVIEQFIIEKKNCYT